MPKEETDLRYSPDEHVFHQYIVFSVEIDDGLQIGDSFSTLDAAILSVLSERESPCVSSWQIFDCCLRKFVWKYE